MTVHRRDVIVELIRSNPGLTTPELAEKMGESVTYARWVVFEVGAEFYDGDHIRMKDDAK